MGPFLHLDLDQFFVSAERLRDPSLVGRPVVVGGDDPTARGAVACASYEARACGVHSGLALRRARALCPQAVFLSGSPERYLELSGAVRALLEARAPRVVPRSIDEFAVDLTGCERLLGPSEEVARAIQAAVLAETGLGSSVGLAPTPLVAKVASGLDKPLGFRVVPAGDQRSFLAPLPLRKLPGIGPVTEERLRTLGLTTLGQLQALDPERLEAALGPHGRALWERAHGGRPELGRGPDPAGFLVAWGKTPENCSAGERATNSGTGSPLPKSLSRNRTFAEDQDDAAVLDSALARLVENATASLRVQRLRARRLAVVVRYADLRVQSRRSRLPRDAEEETVLAVARRLMSRLLERRLRVRRLGVAFHLLYPTWEQLLLFEGPTDRSRRALGLALDRVRDRHGFAAIRFGTGLAD